MRIYLARSTKSNVRELEGALVKLIAYSSVTGHRINLSMAQQVLKTLGQGQEKRVPVDGILRTVAEHFNLQPSQLKQKTNARNISYPRQVAMYIIKDLTQASLAGDRTYVRGQASHHRAALHPED